MCNTLHVVQYLKHFLDSTHNMININHMAYTMALTVI